MKKATKKSSVTLRERELKNGYKHLYLDIYRDGERKRQFLKMYINPKARTPLEREENNRTKTMAERIRLETEMKLLQKEFNIKEDNTSDIDFIKYFQSYNDKYTKKDYRMMTGALQRFKDFLTYKYGSKFNNGIKMSQIDRDMMNYFVEYLQSKSKGEGASNYWQHFKKVIKYAIEHDVITKSPCMGVVCKVDKQVLRKDILSLDEIEKLILTKYPGQNQEIRKAFIFCLYTGLRFCDVKDLKYSNIDYSYRHLKFEQNKTKGHSANSGVVIPLNDSLISLIGNPQKNEFGEINKETLLFNLPSQTMCLKALKRWTARAGIEKHITWHCARHSFAVNILNKGANIKTVASLLGHAGLKHTEKYTRAVDSLKEAAINSLPTFDI